MNAKTTTKTATKAQTKTAAKAQTKAQAAVPFFEEVMGRIAQEPSLSMVRAFIARAAQHHGAKGTKFPRPGTEAVRPTITARDVREYLELITRGGGKAAAGQKKGQAIFDLLMTKADMSAANRAIK